MGPDIIPGELIGGENCVWKAGGDIIGGLIIPGCEKPGWENGVDMPCGPQPGFSDEGPGCEKGGDICG